MEIRCTAFQGDRHIASGPLSDVALAVKAAVDKGGDGPILIFDDETARAIELDLRGTPAEVLARMPAAEPPRGPGRPRLGVVAREVTLLPRHCDWLATQPGGASVALRKLVEAARRDAGRERRAPHEAAFRFMGAMAGNMPGFE